jgi:hypothetical protein
MDIARAAGMQHSRPTRCSSRLLLAAGAGLALAPPAAAIEAFDGRLQIHGFYEAQIRAIANDMDVSDDLDLTQWYNVFNVEVELDIAPDGIGPIEILQMFARVEARFDCIWSRGCGMFPSVNAFGDRTRHLPKRLSGAERSGFDGEQFTGDVRPFHLIPLEEIDFDFKDSAVGDSRRPLYIWHVPGVDTLFGVPGSDGVVGTPDDPAFYTFERFVRDGDEYRWASRKIPGPINGQDNQFLGPWLPKNQIVPLAALADRANPFNPNDFNPIQGPMGGFGAAALPFRPSPKFMASRNSPTNDPSEPRGLFIPNERVAELMRDDEFDIFDQNFRESELQWNRGASQQDEKELKEFYFDMEFFESRLWLRIGKQNIVWGKTELFRTTDQFNPQDIALASLADLEESRIALWAVRAVWSFGRVGFLEDLRLELAINYDDFEPTDLGRCGEPYSPNPVCNKTLGLFAHGVAGFGLAGEIRPPAPWNSWRGIESGARVEWRTGAFSFALTNFYGYDDFPYVDQIFLYERNVDPVTGRPRRSNSRRGCDPEGLVHGDTAGCLEEGDDALYHHSANQQRFAVICSSSIGFSDLDRSVCAQSVFNSQAFARSTDIGNPAPVGPRVSAALAQLLAGDGIGQTIPANSVLLGLLDPDRVFFPNPPGPGDPGAVAFNAVNPLVGLSRDAGDFDGPNTPAGSFLAAQARALDAIARGKIQPSEQFVTAALLNTGLGNRLSDEQEALLGCGPFFQTDCDLDGIDLLNAEMSALIQSFPGFPGTFLNGRPWDTTNAGLRQPGTVGFQGGPVCTRFERGKTFILPGCRGPRDRAYNPAQDGTTDNLVRYLAHPFTGQQWNSEMAVLSWNFLMTLVALSGLGTAENERGIDEFKITDPLRKGSCSFANPQLCTNVSAIFAVAHTTRPITRAAGNGRFGRTDFDWHVGGVGVLRYQKRNVLGFSSDFAEDWTKTNWSIEATWINDIPEDDNGSYDGLSTVDTYNLTVSIDRPTFINFLNANRTFFINTQIFFQYVNGYQRDFTSNGPWNVLATLTFTTGYFQDRLEPTLTFVYDVGSASYAVLPSVSWRFNQDFSVQIGLGFFAGRWEPKTAELNTIGDPPFRVGRDYDKVFEENGLSPIRDRDEIYLRIRYTF